MRAAKDWRGPVGDRLYLCQPRMAAAPLLMRSSKPIHIVNTSRSLNGLDPIAPKKGARFHFSLPGSVQGFSVETTGSASASIENRLLPGTQNERALAIEVDSSSSDSSILITTPTFTPPEALKMPGYELLATPSLHTGQTIRARVIADQSNSKTSNVRVVIRRYNATDQLESERGPKVAIAPGKSVDLEWTAGGPGSFPIQSVGIEVSGANNGSILYFDSLTWNGEPNATFGRPDREGVQWQRAWVNGVDQFDRWWPEPFRIVKNEGIGLVSRGGRDWRNYRVEAPIYIHLATSGGLAARVQGLRRYYALELTNQGTARLVKALENIRPTLAETPFGWEPRKTYRFWIEVQGTQIRAGIDDQHLFDVDDTHSPLAGGGIGLIVDEGTLSSDDVSIRPLT